MKLNKGFIWLIMVSLFISIGSTNIHTAFADEADGTQILSGQSSAGSRTELEQNPVVEQARQQLQSSLAYMVKTVANPVFGTGSGEWTILSLARAGYEVPANYYDSYYANVEQAVTQLMATYNGKLHSTKSTEHSRAILGLTSIGKDVADVAGFNLLTALADFDYVLKQGLNGPVFALIALDSHNYDIPQADGVNQTTRDKLIDKILEYNRTTANAAGWTLFGSKPDVDMTAMTIQSLAPYYTTRTDVKEAVDRALVWLSDNQSAAGDYLSNCESTAQVVLALASLGIDPGTDPRFMKNGKSAVDGMLIYAVPAGGFKHTATGGVNGMATDQGTYALVAYDRFLNGGTNLYDMTDVELEGEPLRSSQNSRAMTARLLSNRLPTRITALR
ncbi:hypothetical protein [Paenibacillus protaetiae]|uniref:Uncharacterized protein n=1 Tax=Paenibacillus protaetiae TaxID=2509456 RepID=A0A4P6F8U0_9BACL|nr:hypothetical protein [Paenibacillus protaetiae]QAY66868.1 hypothetical protein ET464_11145 [Paenibacillus protaetiae]